MKAVNSAPTLPHSPDPLQARLGALLDQGWQLTTEYTDPRRFRRKSWHTGPALAAATPQAALTELNGLLQAHAGDYVRLLAVDPQSKRRVHSEIIQRPGDAPPITRPAPDLGPATEIRLQASVPTPSRTQNSHQGDHQPDAPANSLRETVQNLLQSGQMLGIEHCDARHYKVQTWKSLPPITDGQVDEVVSLLGRFLAQHPNRYVRLLTIDPDTKQRQQEVMIQRPASSPFAAQRGTQARPVVTRPSGPSPEPNPASKQSYSRELHPSLKRAGVLGDIGGLGSELHQLRELIELTLTRPAVLRNLGIDPPRGVLMVGPPGTGKTLTARALAATLGVNYISLVGPELLSKYYGEAEHRLRQVFDEAVLTQPCLIFIDEIDALVPDRAQQEGEGKAGLVAQLLGLMDGFKPLQGVVVLAATNRPNQLDPALRRPGRFEREVRFGVPDRQGRREILAIQTRSMPLAAGVDLDLLAEATAGFVGADLRALTQAGAFLALRRRSPNLDPQDDLSNLRIEHQDLMAALSTVQPSVLRSVAVEVPRVMWEQIGGLERVKRVLQETVEAVVSQSQFRDQLQVQAPRGVLLYGPPGTGKTMLAKAVATQSEANFIGVSGPELLSRWGGAGETAIQELFLKARQTAPCVIFIDELDTLASVRGNGHHPHSELMIGQLLTEMDGLQASLGVMVIAATNRPDEIDPALRRAGRLDVKIFVDLPNRSERLAILKVHNGDRPLSQVDLSHWAEITKGWNGADLALLSNQAALGAMRRQRQQGSSSGLTITEADFAEAFEQQMPAEA